MSSWPFSFFSEVMYSVTVASALNFLFASLHKWLTWQSKLSLLSMFPTSNNVLLALFLMEKSLVWISVSPSVFKVKLYLSSLVFISLSANYLKDFRRFLQEKYDLINIFTCITNCVVGSITCKINILNKKKQITKKIFK